MFWNWKKAKKLKKANDPGPRMKALDPDKDYTKQELREHITKQTEQLRLEMGHENLKQMAEALRKIDEKTGQVKKIRDRAEKMDKRDLTNTLRDIRDGG